MPNSAPQKVLAAARQSLARPLGFAEFLAKLPVKDRATAQRRIDVLEAEPDPTRAHLWRRLACALMTLAPHAAKLIGKQTLQIYIADGKYRMQVFALEDLQDGKFTIYCPDVLQEAIAAGLLAPPPLRVEPNQYIIQASQEPLDIESLTGTSRNPGPHFKDMTGWNRKALCITLSPSPTPTQIEAAELLCAIAAQHFPPPPPPSSTKPK